MLNKPSLISVACLMAACAFSQPLTLEEAARIARANAFEVLAAQQDLRRAEGFVSEARAAGLPTLDLTGSYTRFTRETRVTFDPMAPPIVVRPIDAANIGLRLEQSVDITGAANLGLSGAWALRHASVAMLEAAANDAGTRAKAAFFNVLQAEEFVAVAEEQLRNAQLQLEMARRRIAAGTAPRFDEIRFDAEVGGAEQDLIEVRNGLDLARASFNSALARDVATPVELVPPGPPPAIEASLEELTALALELRPEIAAAGYSAEYQTRFRQVLQRENLPTIKLSADLSHNPRATGFGAERETISATAVLSVPIFDGGRSRARVQQARADEARALIVQQQLAHGVTLEVRAAWLDVQAARQALETAERRVASAREALRLANVRYEEGVGTTVEVSDANVLFIGARTAHVNASYDYWDAVARLQRAVGRENL